MTPRDLPESLWAPEQEFQVAAGESPVGTASYVVQTCSGVESGRWVSDGTDGAPQISVDDLVPGIWDHAQNQIGTPVLQVNPSAEVGGIVNLGLWLAIDEPAPIAARAEVGSVWAQVTATLVGTTWDMGNGAIVECGGAGDPIVDTDTYDESPICGYTYEQPSTPEFTGGGESYQLTVTAHWTLTLTGSDGRNVALAPENSTFSVAYVVREIITVGVVD